MMRRRGPGLMRAAATTAVVAGTATAVSGGMRRRQDQKYAAQDQQAYDQQMAQQQAQQSQAPQAAAQPGYMDELAKLAQLKQQGVISEDEFQAKKKQILGL